MTDIHTHILPRIDDGAKDVSVSREMLRIESSLGVDKLLLTSHFYPYAESIENFTEKREKSDAMLTESYKEFGIARKLASETFFDDILLHFSDLSQLCAEDSSRLLLELPYDRSNARELIRKTDRLMEKYLVLPVVAHIERCAGLARNERAIRELQKNGCLIQMNASYVVDAGSRRHALKLINRGCVDIIASDCHDTGPRPPNLAEAYAVIEDKLGPDDSEWLKKNADFIFGK